MKESDPRTKHRGLPPGERVLDTLIEADTRPTEALNSCRDPRLGQVLPLSRSKTPSACFVCTSLATADPVESRPRRQA
jgi:hypothetical protein